MQMREEQRVEMGERIRELRQPPRPQKVIARALGVELRTYQHWEAGTGGISWANLEALAEFHGVTTDYLLNGNNGNSPISESPELLARELADLKTAFKQLSDAVEKRLPPQDD